VQGIPMGGMGPYEAVQETVVSFKERSGPIIQEPL